MIATVPTSLGNANEPRYRIPMMDNPRLDPGHSCTITRMESRPGILPAVDRDLRDTGSFAGRHVPEWTHWGDMSSPNWMDVTPSS